MKKVQKINIITFLSKILKKDDIIQINDEYYVNYHSLNNFFPFTYLFSYCKKNSHIGPSKQVTSFISCKNLICCINKYIREEDIIGGNKVTNTRGKISIMFELYFESLGTKYITKDIFVGDYKYNIIYDIKLKKNKITPFKREAFKESHIIKKNIDRTYGPNLTVEYEVDLKDGTGKIYDVVIKYKDKYIIAIEIQENSSNHNINNVNDQYKKAIINSKGMRMLYLEIGKADSIIEYREDFYAYLSNLCYTSLIALSKEFRNEQILLEIGILNCKEITNLEEQLSKINKETETDKYEIIESEIKKWKSISDDENKSIEQIKVLYKYKVQAYENPKKDIISKYNIPLDNVIKNLDLDIVIDDIGKKCKKNDDLIQIENLIMRYTIKYNETFYISYENIIKLLVALNIESIFELKMQFIHILTCTQEIYEKYIKIIEEYKNSQIEKLSADCNNIKIDIENRCNIISNRKIERRDEKIKILKETIKKLEN
jgi:hypothetical protein